MLPTDNGEMCIIKIFENSGNRLISTFRDKLEDVAPGDNVARKKIFSVSSLT